MKYRIELNADKGPTGQWEFAGRVTRHDHATTTVAGKVVGIDLAAALQLCGDAITEDIAWQQRERPNHLEVLCDD